MKSRLQFVRDVSPGSILPGLFSGRSVKGGNYEAVKTQNDRQNQPAQDGQGVQRRPGLYAIAQHIFAQCSRRLILATIALLAFLILATKTLPTTRPSQPGATTGSKHTDQRFHLFIPSTNTPDLAFCRTELTAGILRYPTPQILNHEGSGRTAASLQRDQIRVINDYLNGMTESHDNDKVIVLNGANSWFQLRPEVFMERYYRIVQQADQRARQHADSKAHFTHRVVVTTQDRCSGHKDDLTCFAQPKSPRDQASTMRWLNADLMVGPVKDVRSIFNRLNGKAIAHTDDDGVSQQNLLTDVFGEQELRREVVRQGLDAPGAKKLQAAFRALRGVTPAQSEHAMVVPQMLAEDPENERFEMGIVLDYGNELGLSVSLGVEEEQAEFKRHGHEEQASSPLPPEIARSMPPYWTTMSNTLPINESWADVSLLTSKNTGGIPAVVSVVGDWRLEERRRAEWKALWLHTHARQLWEAQQAIPRLPLMSVVDDQGTEHTFWNQELKIERDGANWVEGGWKPWSDHCGWDEGGEVVLRADVPS